MAAPLLGLASLLGREYAYTRPSYKEQDDLLKILSPQTYYGNQLINYLTDKFGVRSSLPEAQNAMEQASRRTYDNGPKGISQEEYDRQMADLSAQVNAPGSVEKFENYLRDADYGTISPNAQNFTGPQAEGSYASQYAADSFPVTVGQLPAQSNFTPEQLAVLEQMLLGKSADMGPQLDAPDTPRKPDFTPQGAGEGFMPQGGGDFMPQDSGFGGGGGKVDFDVQQEYEQYLRGGLIQRRR
jgi:hypothetical protein